MTLKQFKIDRLINKNNYSIGKNCVACAIANALDCSIDELTVPNTSIELSKALCKIPGITYRKLQYSIEEIKKELYITDNYLIFGYQTSDSFNNVKDGYINFNKDDELLLIGHCLVCCGFDDDKQAFLCIDNRRLTDDSLIWISYDYPINEIWQIENYRDKIIEPKANTNKYVANPSYTETYLCMGYETFLSHFYDCYNVKRELLGIDSLGKNTYYYVFEPEHYVYTILLSAGMNACELTSIFGLAYFIQEVMSKNIYNFKQCVRFVVLPIICPSSFDMDNKKYTNPNNVRINKNFDFNDSWNSINVDIMGTKGEYPDSEMETLNLKRWIRKFQNANLWIDCHCDLENIDNPMFQVIVSHEEILQSILLAQRKIKKYYESKGYYNIFNGLLDTDNMIENGDLFPKTLYAWEIENIPSIMIEQFALSKSYGASGKKQCEANSIKNYIILISQYCLEIIKGGNLQI